MSSLKQPVVEPITKSVENEEPAMENGNASVPISMTLWSYPSLLLIALTGAAIYFFFFSKPRDALPTASDATEVISTDRE